MTGQEKGDLLIQVTAWAGLTVHYLCTFLTVNCTRLGDGDFFLFSGDTKVGLSGDLDGMVIKGYLASSLSTTACQS